MPDLFGGTWSPGAIRRRAGRMAQLADARPFVFDDGPARGMRGIDVRTGGGLAFTVLPDRGMDIGAATFRDVPLAWQSPTGPVRPERYEPEGLGWLRSFYAGLVTTCGLRHVGVPQTEDGQTWGLHGRAAHLAASDVAVTRGWEGDRYVLRLRGRLAEAEVFQPTVVLERTIETGLGERALVIRDRVTNEGFAPSSAMLLYHVNLGWPLLGPTSRLLLDAESVMPRTDHAAAGLDAHTTMADPTPGFEEQVYLIEPRAGADGLCRAALVNPDLGGGLAVALAWPKATLGHLTQWKMVGEGTYVLGIEPCNAPLLERAALREEGLMPELAPGEAFETTLAIGIHAGAAELEVLERLVTGG